MEKLKVTLEVSPLLGFYHVWSILRVKQNQTILNRIHPFLSTMISNLGCCVCEPSSIFFPEVIHEYLSQLKPTITSRLLEQLVNTPKFMPYLLETFQSGDTQRSIFPLRILTLLTNTKY